MSQGRHGIKVLGLLLIAALGLMAFTAAAAQAGEFKIGEKTVENEKKEKEQVLDKTFTAAGLSSESVSGTVGAGKLLVPGLKLTFLCTGGTASGTVLLGGTVHATILFSGCSVEGNTFCKTYETKEKMKTHLLADRGFIAASGLGEIVLMSKTKNEKGEEVAPFSHYILVSSGATPFSTIYLSSTTEGCTLPLEEPVTGSTVFFAPNALKPLVNQTLSTMTQAELEALFPSDVLKYGNQTAWLDEGGTTNAALSGANIGKAWGGE